MSSNFAKIALVVKQYHPGNPADYLRSAFAELGHEVSHLTEAELHAQHSAFNYLICVDSGEALNLEPLPQHSFSKLCYWFIDYRHNKHRPSRKPTDFENAKRISQSGGWVFQAQKEDFEECQQTGISRSSWLPLAADPAIWSDTPAEEKEEKQAQFCFIGHVWDEGRLAILQTLAKQGFKCLLSLDAKLWKEDAARLQRRAQIGFNVNSFFGSAYAYDINMRFFETLSCGVPLLTNAVPSLPFLITDTASFVRTYTNAGDLPEVARDCLRDEKFLQSGQAARAWILSAHTYRHRAENILSRLSIK